MSSDRHTLQSVHTGISNSGPHIKLRLMLDKSILNKMGFSSPLESNHCDGRDYILNLMTHVIISPASCCTSFLADGFAVYLDVWTTKKRRTLFPSPLSLALHMFQPRQSLED
ncbi:hypothetical protein JOB18_033416 [Solea senegalensis]|uniref:Uncharacterized protein n=1 Tax=Solea senegalensis TaxID=28829 RepID=A0AAV6RJ35_SOLSE|nr:hypothetical protein JOB18_033416 [Solea senegalensis]KAG7505512.1 hypothetical protein JOB18_033416 [Solea senegalensis]